MALSYLIWIEHLDNFQKGMEDTKKLSTRWNFNDVKRAVNFKTRTPNLPPLDGIDSASKPKDKLQIYQN